MTPTAATRSIFSSSTRASVSSAAGNGLSGASGWMAPSTRCSRSGAHAMAGTRGGVLYHTWSAQIRQIRLCGVPIGEIGLEAFAAGAYGLPMIYVTGDTAACREAEALVPNITTVAVKHGLSRYSEISHPPAKACQLIAEGAQRAIANLASVKPFLPPPPYTWQLDQYPDDADCMKSNPADLPGTWTTIEDVRADSALNLIHKAWGREV